MDVAFDPLLKAPLQYYWIMNHIFVVPNQRKSSVYARLLYTVIDNCKGQIIGFTYKNSDHNAVLSKRYKVLGTIYGRHD